MTKSHHPPHSQSMENRKEDHIHLARSARTGVSLRDTRFYYEPLFFSHPKQEELWPVSFLGFSLDYPIWVSSMTGGVERAKKINENLARLCGEFHLGMGLGSCRSLLSSDSRLDEFKVKKFMPSAPLFANLGIAQVEELLSSHKVERIHEMVKKVEADGLIIHINPLQEWFQPEGDRFHCSPLETLQRFLDDVDYPVLVKEVGQGMGPKSLKALLELPLRGVELSGFGGTNFTLLENLRGKECASREGFIRVGHTCREMIDYLNALLIQDKDIIISGGINSTLDGLDLMMRLKTNSVIGMASAFLNPAMESYESLRAFFLDQRESLLTARSLLVPREDHQV